MPDPVPSSNSAPDVPAAGPSTLLDTHVHIHDCFDPVIFLDRASENFRRHGDPSPIEQYPIDQSPIDQYPIEQSPIDQYRADRNQKGRNPNGNRNDSRTGGVLLLTESHGVDAFGKLRQVAESGASIGDWRPRRTDEPESLRLVRGDGRELVIVAGRQVVTGERLEILALGMLDDPDDGMPIADVIRYVQDRNALCVLPWGFGKWTGRRGRLVREILASPPGRNFFLGDNAGRLAMWPPPREFAQAKALGIPVLAGTDPLPWSSQAGSAGGFGTRIDGVLDERRPFASVREHLLGAERHAVSFGKLERLLPFVTHQVGMQLRNRLS